MDHMKQASVRDLRYRFADVEDLLREGQEIQITKRRRVIARLVPGGAVALARPDFLARLKQVYGRKVLKISGADLLTQERERD
jgi:antitoxin (DNA-binding transcriptional repressor) of toxin-antitoxin stability system